MHPQYVLVFMGCICKFSSAVCVVPAGLYAHMNMCCMVTGWKPLTSQMRVGPPCSGSSLCGAVADGKQLSFACVFERVSVWCGHRLKKKREPQFTWEQMTGSGLVSLSVKR